MYLPHAFGRACEKCGTFLRDDFAYKLVGAHSIPTFEDFPTEKSHTWWTCYKARRVAKKEGN